MSADPASPKEANLTDQAARPGRLRRWASWMVGSALRIGLVLFLFFAAGILWIMYGGERVPVPGFPLSVRLPQSETWYIGGGDGVAWIGDRQFDGSMVLRSVPVPEGARPGEWERLPDGEGRSGKVFTGPDGTLVSGTVPTFRYRKVFRPDLAIEVEIQGLLLFDGTVRESIQLAPED